MTDTFILRRTNIIEMFYPLFYDKFPEYINITPGINVFCKYIMIRDYNNLFSIPYPGIAAEFPFKYLYCPRTANIMCHKDIYIYPYIVTRRYCFLSGMPCKDLFCYCHSHSRYFCNSDTGLQTLDIRLFLSFPSSILYCFCNFYPFIFLSKSNVYGLLSEL